MLRLLPPIIALTISLSAQTPGDPYTWTPVTPPLTQARADACAVALPDGSAFVTGGVGINTGALASVDKFQPGQGFAAGPAMNNARSSHTCTALKDGRILVVGGTDGHGNPIGTAEVYDPTAQTWSVVADLNVPRWGHTATLLNNGRVLIAGGQDSRGQKDTLELFEPKKSALVLAPATLSSPRVNHTAALLPDGIVAIMGGTNGAGPLALVDLYDPTRNTVIAAAPLLTARMSHIAATLLDGTILVAGGTDGKNDLNTAEIYNPAKGSAFTIAKLNTARHGHFAMTLPGNGNILLGGGVGANASLASCELYNPSDGTFSLTGSLATPRARATAVALAQGMVLSAGGVSSDGVTPIVSTGVLAAPTMTFSLKGATTTSSLVVRGKSFPKDRYIFLLSISNTRESETITLDTTTLAGGTIVFNTEALPKAGFSGTWTLTAKGSGAPITSSQPVIFSDVSVTSSCNPCIVGQPLTITARINNLNPNLTANAMPSAGDLISLVDLNQSIGATQLGTAPFVTSSRTATFSTKLSLATGTHTLIGSVGKNADGFGGASDGFIGVSQTPLMITVNPIPTTLSISTNPNPALFGTPVTVKAALSFNSAQATALGKSPSGTVTYSDDLLVQGQEPLGTPFTFVAPTIDFLDSFNAAYSGDAFFAPSNAGTILTLEPPQLLIPFFGSVAGGGQLTWQLFTLTSLAGGKPFATFNFGDGSWIPVTGDWQGVGQSEVGAFDPATDTWHLAGPPTGPVAEITNFKFGRASCPLMPQTGPPLAPFLGDWTGSGRAGVGVYDPSSGFWCLSNLAAAGAPDFQFKFAEFNITSVFGINTQTPLTNQLPVVGDWDGNGTTTIGVFDRINGIWLLRNENSAGPADANTSQFVGDPGILKLVSSGQTLPVLPIPGPWTIPGGAVPGKGGITSALGIYNSFSNQFFVQNSSPIALGFSAFGTTLVSGVIGQR